MQVYIIIAYIFYPNIKDIVAYSELYNFREALNVKIPIPRKSPEDFCGNVYLFDKDDNEYSEFTIDGRK
jgi:hypothetical protein